MRDAAEDSKLLALLFQFFVVGQAVKDFLLGFVANRTGVVENQAGFFHGWNLAVSLRDEGANDLLGVVGVHLASERFQVKSFLRGGHKGQYSAGFQASGFGLRASGKS